MDYAAISNRLKQGYKIDISPADVEKHFTVFFSDEVRLNSLFDVTANIGEEIVSSDAYDAWVNTKKKKRRTKQSPEEHLKLALWLIAKIGDADMAIKAVQAASLAMKAMT